VVDREALGDVPTAGVPDHDRTAHADGVQECGDVTAELSQGVAGRRLVRVPVPPLGRQVRVDAGIQVRQRRRTGADRGDRPSADRRGTVGDRRRRGEVMPIFMIERRFAEDLEASVEVADRINRINEEEGVRWLYSFLSADKRKTYCLYEAPFADAIRRAAERAGLPADVVVELGDRLLPDGSLAGSAVT
jgi:hypothetical protein